MPLSTLVGPAVVADLEPAGPLEEISLARLQAAVGGGLRHPRLLLRFGWSARFGRMDFYTESPFLARDACTWLVEQEKKKKKKKKKKRGAGRHGHPIAR